MRTSSGLARPLRLTTLRMKASLAFPGVPWGSCTPEPPVSTQRAAVYGLPCFSGRPMSAQNIPSDQSLVPVFYSDSNWHWDTEECSEWALT